MNKNSFGTIKSGAEAFTYEIANSKGIKAIITDFGATVVSLFVPAKDGKVMYIVLGYDDAATYERQGCYFGAIIGRYANRISDAKVTIDGVEYQLEANDNENTLHSGSNGISHKLWDVKNYTDNAITLEIVSRDLEQGFP